MEIQEENPDFIELNLPLLELAENDRFHIGCFY